MGKIWPGDRIKDSHPAGLRLQAPDGAQVASPQSPILRWSKVSVSRFRYRGGL